MRNYEIAYIADPDLDEQSLTALEDKVKGWLETAGATISKVDHWGKRRMAYQINKHPDGVIHVRVCRNASQCWRSHRTRSAFE